jgi:hypothetical protein
MDDPILTPRGVGRYVTAADVADLKPNITDRDARLFIDGAGAREHTLQPRRVLDRPRPLQKGGCITLSKRCITLSKPLRYCAFGLFVAACLLYAYVLAVGAAFGAVVGSPIQAESMSESSSQVAPFTGAGGVSMMRWSSGATTNAAASISINPNQQVDQVVVQTRQASGGTGVMAIVVDGSVVGTFRPGTSGFAPITVDLTSPVSAGQHTFMLRPNATLPARLDVDFFELHNAGGTAPAQCADNQDNDGDGLVDLNDPGCSSSTDNDETNTTEPPPTGSFNRGLGTTPQSACSRNLASGSIENALPNVPSGGTLCLTTAGPYTEGDGRLNLGNAQNKTIAGLSGVRPSFRGSIQGGSSVGVTLRGFEILGQYAPLANRNNNTFQPIDAERARDLTAVNMRFQNRGLINGVRRGGSCIFGGTSDGLTIRYSLVQSCGEHGIYGGNETRNMLVEHVWIEDVELSGFKTTHTLANNVFRGVVVNRFIGPLPGTGPWEQPGHAAEAGLYNDTPTGNSVENSVFYSQNDQGFLFSAAYNGSNNRFVNNCVHDPQLGNAAPSDTVSGNTTATPTFNSTTFKVTGPSSCIAELPADSPFRP